MTHGISCTSAIGTEEGEVLIGLSGSFFLLVVFLPGFRKYRDRTTQTIVKNANMLNKKSRSDPDSYSNSLFLGG
jgi:hypothetical protein